MKTGTIEMSVILLLIGCIVTLIVRIHRMTKRESFYRAVIDGNYLELLGYLSKPNEGRSLLGKISYQYETYLGIGLRKAIDSKLRDWSIGSATKRLRKVLDAKERLSNATGPVKKLHVEIRSVILDCPPERFAFGFSRSTSDDELEARELLLAIYSECLNSNERKWIDKGKRFVELVNQEIEETLKCDFPQGEEERIAKNRLQVEHFNAKTTYRISSKE